MRGSRHLSIGSRNALVDLGNDAYLAIDGPDSQQSLVGTHGALLASAASPVLWRFAVQMTDLSAAKNFIARRGLETAIGPGSRTTSAGGVLEWDTLSVASLDLGLGMPIIKDGGPAITPSAKRLVLPAHKAYRIASRGAGPSIPL